MSFFFLCGTPTVDDTSDFSGEKPKAPMGHFDNNNGDFVTFSD